jgi:hypothetical protein
MTVTDDTGRNFKGANENVSVTVEARNTNFLVNYVEDGVDKVLSQGESIDFEFPANTAKNIEFSFRFSTPSGGSYKVTVVTVEGFPDGRTRTFNQQGAVPVIADYTFVPQ